MNLSHLFLLLKLKTMILINGFTKGPAKKRMRQLLGIIGGGFLFIIVFQWIFEIFSILNAYPNAIIENSLTMIFLGFFVFLLASGATVSIHYLFVSSDLPLLITSPLSNRTIFSFKLIEAIIANSAFFFFMGFPIFIAYGVVMQASWFYYPLMLINALVFLAIPVALSFLGALFVIRIVPPARAREIMAIFLGIISLGIWLVLQLVRASSFDQNSQDFDPQNIEALQHISHFKLFDLLPSTLAAQALKGCAGADIKLIAITFVPLILLAGSIWLFGTHLARTAFERGFISSEASLTLKRKSKSPATAISASRTPGYISTRRHGAIFVRDFKLLTRDTRQIMNIVLFAAMMIILPLLQKPEQSGAEYAIYVPYGFLIFFTALIAGQVSSRLIPLEGKAFWITKLSPHPSFRILIEKFFLGFAISTILAWLAVIINWIYFHHPLRVMILALLASMSFSGALSSIGILLATRFARFDWDHPKRMLSTAGGLLLSLATLLMVAVIGGPAVFVYLFGSKLDFAMNALDLIAGSLVIFISTICIVIAIIIGGKNLDKMEWTC